MAYSSNLPAVRAQMAHARDMGLIAAAEVGITNTRNAFTPDYYTGGQYSEGATRAAVTRTEPFDGPEGRAIKYGTNLKYNLWYEVGFNQRLWVWFDEKRGRWYSRPGPTRFVRKPIWMPVFVDSQPEMVAAFDRTFWRFMNQRPVSEAADD